MRSCSPGANVSLHEIKLIFEHTLLLYVSTYKVHKTGEPQPSNGPPNGAHIQRTVLVGILL